MHAPASADLLAHVELVFANEAWLFSATFLAAGSQVTTEDQELLLRFRTAQLDIAGGEPPGADAGDAQVAPDATALERFLPTSAPPGFLPAGGITTDLNTFADMTGGDFALAADQYAFLQRHTTARMRLWMGPAGGLAVIATEYPYDVLAGLALGTFQDGRYAAIESTAAPAVVNLLAVEIPLVSGDGNFTLESFRRGRLGYQIMAFGDNASEREALASQAAVAAAALAPPGASAPIQPPSATRSIVQAVVATALVIVGALAIRRLLAGRARRLAPVAAPAPILVDVSRDAATLRRDGRRLATLQIAACAVVVVGLVADVGWWWVFVVAVGVAIGLTATARARRRELARSPGRWSLPSARTSLLGLVGALLVLVGVACAVRGLKEWVLLPSLTHLRLADRVGVSPDRLAAAMAVAGIVALVLAAVVLRRARAHARSDRKRAVGAGRGDDILYLRSFEDDRLSVPSVHSARRPFFELFGVRGRDPFEEGVAWELAAQGQLTAIGRPGASTLSLGATRDLVDEDEWQSAVTARMAASRWVVLALGATAGLEWEVDALVRHGHLAKTMFVVPPLAADAIESRWLATRRTLDHACGRLFVAPVRAAGTLTIRVDAASGVVSAARADRLDEAAYRAAIEQELSALLQTAPAKTGAPPPVPVAAGER